MSFYKESGSIGSATTSNNIRAKNVDVFISGTFVADVDIEIRDSEGVWHVLEQLTAPGVRVVEAVGMRPLRINVSSYTSGSVVYLIEGHSRA